MKKQWVQKIAWIMDSSLSQGELQCKTAYEKRNKKNVKGTFAL